MCFHSHGWHMNIVKPQNLNSRKCVELIQHQKSVKNQIIKRNRAMMVGISKVTWLAYRSERDINSVFFYLTNTPIYSRLNYEWMPAALKRYCLTPVWLSWASSVFPRQPEKRWNNGFKEVSWSIAVAQLITWNPCSLFGVNVLIPLDFLWATARLWRQKETKKELLFFKQAFVLVTSY